MPIKNILTLITVAVTLALAACSWPETKPESKPAEPVKQPRTPPPVRRDSAQEPGLQVAVLDPADYADAKAGHKQALLNASENPLGGDDIGYYMDIQEARLIQVLRNESVGIKREGDNITLNVPGGITFGSNSARIKADAHGALSAIAEVLGEYQNTQVSIYGHTDDAGEADYNQKLSEQRALSVAQYLVDAGVNKKRIVIIGHGESLPVVSNATSEGRAQNRRIELQLEPVAYQEGS